MKLQTSFRKSRVITLGSLKIGGGSRVLIQSMLSESLSEPKRCIEKIDELKKAGCDIVRIAVRNSKEILNVRDIKKEVTTPLIADIQFNYEHALEAIKEGFDGVRINPGYIRDEEKALKIIDFAGERNCLIRVGINTGSLPSEFYETSMAPKDFIMNLVDEIIEKFERKNFKNYKFSIKSSNVLDTIDLNRSLSQKTDAPIHLGLTEAGPTKISAVRSSIAIGTLLLEGIGDTIRVSVTGDTVEEIIIAKEILRSVGLLNQGINLISCPTCARCSFPLLEFTESIQRKTLCFKVPIKIAIMGCMVNGPGEAKGADMAIIGVDSNRVAYFKKGVKKGVFEIEDAMNIFLKELEENERA